MAEIWHVLSSVYECCHVYVWLESDRRPDISTWRVAKWQRYDVSYCQCMNVAMLICGWNQTGDLTSLPGGLPNGRDMTCLILSLWMLPCRCAVGIRQETWHLYLEGCQMADMTCLILSLWMLPCRCAVGIRQETWHLYLEGRGMMCLIAECRWLRL